MAAADPEVVRDTATEILSRPEFGDHRSLLERAIDWIVGIFSDLLGRITAGLSSGTGFLGVLIQISLVVGAAVLVAFVIREIHRAAKSRRRKPKGDGLVVVFGEKADPARLVEEAEAAEADGRWKPAALARYRHLVASLVLADVLQDLPGRTTGEYRIEYAAMRPDSAHMFDRATLMFEQAYYGDAKISENQYDEMVHLTSELLPTPVAVGSKRVGS